MKCALLQWYSDSMESWSSKSTWTNTNNNTHELAASSATHCHPPTHSLSVSHAVSLSRTQSRSPAHSLTHSPTHELTNSHSVTNAIHSRTHELTQPHSLTLTKNHSRTLTRTDSRRLTTRTDSRINNPIFQSRLTTDSRRLTHEDSRGQRLMRTAVRRRTHGERNTNSRRLLTWSGGRLLSSVQAGCRHVGMTRGL